MTVNISTYNALHLNTTIADIQQSLRVVRLYHSWEESLNMCFFSFLSDGSHTLIVYAEDMGGNIGASREVNFSIKTFPSTWILGIPVIVLMVVAIAYLYSIRSQKREKKHTLNDLSEE